MSTETYLAEKSVQSEFFNNATGETRWLWDCFKNTAAICSEFEIGNSQKLRFDKQLKKLKFITVFSMFKVGIPPQKCIRTTIVFILTL